MKKIFFGLLIIAAAAGAYYFLQNKKPSTKNTVEKELLAGTWKLDTFTLHPRDSMTAGAFEFVAFFDSTFSDYKYEVDKKGEIKVTSNSSDSSDSNTAYYEWNKDNELFVKGKREDTAHETFRVLKLTTDSLLLQTKDSTALVFTKWK